MQQMSIILIYFDIIGSALSKFDYIDIQFIFMMMKSTGYNVRISLCLPLLKHNSHLNFVWFTAIFRVAG